MITKALLIVWLGAGTTQTITITKFDSPTECDAAKAVLIPLDYMFNDTWVRCVPYTYAE